MWVFSRRPKWFSLPSFWGGSKIGLTALRSDEVIDLMIKEYPAKHAEYSVILQEKERQRITDHYKEYSVSIAVTGIFIWFGANDIL